MYSLSSSCCCNMPFLRSMRGSFFYIIQGGIVTRDYCDTMEDKKRWGGERSAKRERERERSYFFLLGSKSSAQTGLSLFACSLIWSSLCWDSFTSWSLAPCDSLRCSSTFFLRSGLNAS